MLSAWNERYFRINEDTLELEYFKEKPSSASAVPSNVIHLDSIYEVMELDNFRFQLKTTGNPNLDNKNTNNTKNTNTTGNGKDKGRDYLLQASNGSEYMTWMYELKYYVDSLNEYNEREDMLLTVAASTSNSMKSDEYIHTAPSSTYSEHT